MSDAHLPPPSASPPASVPTSARHAPVVLDSIAQILSELATSAEDLGDVLSDNPQVLTEHLTQIQRIDVFCQTLCQLSEMLSEHSAGVGDDAGAQSGVQSKASVQAADRATLKRLRAQLAAASPNIAA